MIRHSSYSCREYRRRRASRQHQTPGPLPMGCRPHRHGRAQPTPAARACRNWTAAASFPTRDRAKRYTRAASSRAAGYPVRSPQGAPSLATPPPAPRAPQAPQALLALLAQRRPAAARNPAHHRQPAPAHKGRRTLRLPPSLAGKLSCGQRTGRPSGPAQRTRPTPRLSGWPQKNGSWARYDSVFYARVQPDSRDC